MPETGERLDSLSKSFEQLTTVTLPQIVRDIQNNIAILSDKVEQRFSEAVRRSDEHYEALFERQNKIVDRRPNVVNLLGAAAGAVAVVLSILGAFGTLAKSHIDSDISGITTALRDMNATFIPRGEIQVRREQDDQKFSALLKAVDRIDNSVVYYGRFEEFEKREDERHSYFVDETHRTIAELTSQVKELRSQIVSREENQSHWDDARERFQSLTGRVNDMQREFGGAFTVGDQLKNLQAQLDQMRAQISTANQSLINNPPPVFTTPAPAGAH